jgi:pyridoxal phosphate enzyme (YggS family)
MSHLSERIKDVELRIEQACLRSGRSKEEINVIAVTKYVSTETTLAAVKLGLEHLGENRWQNARDKWEALEGEAELGSISKPTWHYIGSLQTNKAKDVVGKFTYIHSLDRLSLAQAIDKQAVQLGIIVPCFIQVNVSGEDSKHGLSPDQLYEFVDELTKLSSIKPIGLMTMAPFEAESEETRPVFKALRELRDALHERAQAMNTTNTITELSMGMSNDFEVAIEEGATWIRLGTVLIGKEEE